MSITFARAKERDAAELTQGGEILYALAWFP